jgi:MoxR-like ATPase
VIVLYLPSESTAFRDMTDEGLLLPGRVAFFDPREYVPNRHLVDAVNVALLLGQPLLVTGEPGSGKTMLAYSIASELRLDAPLRFDVKSTTSAKDLFYTYDALVHLRDSQISAQARPIWDYIRFNALGKAILGNRSPTNASSAGDLAISQSGRRSVVLIDEIDKAPRDVPNDILQEIETLSFSVTEAGAHFEISSVDAAPILVFTSNSERPLPDPFLRRCVYYHIPFPDPDRLTEIIVRRISSLRRGTLLGDALTFFLRLRDAVIRPPGTAELLNWLYVLNNNGLTNDERITDWPALLEASLYALVKTSEDLQRAVSLMRGEWLNGRPDDERS